MGPLKLNKFLVATYNKKKNRKSLALKVDIVYINDDLIA